MKKKTKISFIVTFALAAMIFGVAGLINSYIGTEGIFYGKYALSDFTVYAAETETAEESTESVIGKTKYNVSVNKDYLLAVTTLTDISTVYEVGYDFGDSYTVAESDQTEKNKYYTSIKAGENTWSAADIFGDTYTSETPMIVWEVAYNAANEYSYKAYAKTGTLGEDGLHVNDPETVVYGNSITVKATNRFAFSFANYTYGTAASTPVVSLEPFDAAVVTYTFLGRGDTIYSETQTAPVNAGMYTVKAVVADTDHYTGLTISVDFIVEKAENRLAFSFADYVYGAEASEPDVTAEPFGEAQITYSYIGRNGTEYESSATPPSQIGEYTVIGETAETSNYLSASFSVDFAIARPVAAQNEIEFFREPGTESQLIAAGVTSKTWVESYEGEKGVIRLDFTNRGAVALDIIPRRTLAEYQQTGLSRIYLKVYVANETTGLATINIMNDGKNKKPFKLGAWQIISFSAKYFEKNYTLFADNKIDNGFFIAGSSATGTIYISEFGYVPAANGEVENFDDGYSLAGTLVNGATTSIVDEYEGETGVLKLSFTNRGAIAFDVTPRIAQSVCETEGVTKLSLKVYIPETTTGLTALKLANIASTNSLSTKGQWITLEWNIADFISVYDNYFADDILNNAFLITGSSATGDMYIASISVK